MSMSRKRPALPSAGDDPQARSSADPSSSSGDRMIGVDVGGRVFYTHISTLTNAGGSYFEVRFGGTFSPGSLRRDEHGRDVYFVDGDSNLFAYILEYLRRGVQSWPDFRDDPVLWRRLRAEADYFGIESLAEALRVTHSCRPDATKGIDRGVLFWLGTKKGSAEYRNPIDVGAVALHKNLAEIGKYSNVVKSERDFVHYRPLVTDASEHDEDKNAYDCASGVLNCGDSRDGSSVPITLSDVSVRPTHYSLRYEHCFGMDSWNFEASIDGDKWDVLHKARGDPHLREPSREKCTTLEKLLRDTDGTKDKRAVATAFAERELRHTWTLDPSPEVFYSYFRFVGAGREYFDAFGDAEYDMEDGKYIHSGCMHGVGFELFGDIYEN